MVTDVEGDLLTSPAQTLVNTVNLVGVMGKGLALQLKQVYPEMFVAYQAACKTGVIAVGRPWLYKTSRKWIVNFPTKRHWRNPSRIDDIEKGLQTFARTCVDEGIYSVAFPALGCGNGDLEWKVVRPLMERYLSNLPIDVFIYPPKPQREPPEHRVPKAIREWLRSEPMNLPAREVWDDLVSIAESQFTVHLAEVPGFELEQFMRQMQFDLAGKTITLYEADLEVLWDILRSHGFLDQSILNQWLGLDIALIIWDLLVKLPYLDVVYTFQNNKQGQRIPTLQLRLPAQVVVEVPEFEVSVSYGR
jgi:O-acetyl-ADP-ribose deacetylase (regulator of RNase III)